MTCRDRGEVVTCRDRGEEVTCLDSGEKVTCRNRGEEVTCLDRGEKVTCRDRRTLILVAIICLLLLLLSYHRHLRVISEALELCVEGERVNHSWCMGVVGHGYGGLGGDRDGGGGWYSCVTRPGWLVACREMVEHFWNAR